MSSSLVIVRKPVCYRCRKTASKHTKLKSCSICDLFWHLECISPPLPPLDGEWMCPQHQKAIDPKKRSSKKSSKSKARADIIESFEEADEIIKYGGVIHDISEEAVQNEFLEYARRYRKYNGSKEEVMIPSSRRHLGNNDVKVKVEAEEWLDSLTSFQFCETNHNNGIQLLIDATNTQLNEISTNEYSKSIDLDEKEYERFEAIQELINLKGEDALLEILSEN